MSPFHWRHVSIFPCLMTFMLLIPFTCYVVSLVSEERLELSYLSAPLSENVSPGERPRSSTSFRTIGSKPILYAHFQHTWIICDKNNTSKARSPSGKPTVRCFETTHKIEAGFEPAKHDTPGGHLPPFRAHYSDASLPAAYANSATRSCNGEHDRSRTYNKWGLNPSRLPIAPHAQTRLLLAPAHCGGQ